MFGDAMQELRDLLDRELRKLEEEVEAEKQALPESLRLVWENEFPKADNVEAFANGIAELCREVEELEKKLAHAKDYMERAKGWIDDALMEVD